MKKLIITGYLAFGILSFAGCANQDTDTVTQPQTVSEGVSQETVTDTTKAAATEALAAAIMQETTQSEEEAVMTNQEIKAFARGIQEAVASKDLERLADMLTFPVYVEVDTGMEITSREQFLALDPDKVFTDGLLHAIAQVNLDQLSLVEAGVVMGEGTPNIIFNETEDGFGITGINQ